MFNVSLDLRLTKILVVCAAVLLWKISYANAQDSMKAHHTRDGFRNIHKNVEPGFLGFLKWRWDRFWMDLPNPESFTFPMAKNDPSFLKSNREHATLTWIGHATVLVQMEGKNILTDPHFSDRASPVSWIGPKRVVPPGLSLEDLPHVDIVVISHDHYDSLDTPTVRRLIERPGGDRTTFYVPLGLKAWFDGLGIKRVFELDWWEGRNEDGLEIIAVPVHHWSKRGLISRNRTLWAGWVVKGQDFSFFFAGDSGYKPVFKEIGERLGPFDLSVIPIGAYEPRWFMKYHHMSPSEAVRVHLDVGSKKSVGVHWGTFPLTDEPLDEPPRELAKARESYRLAEDEFVALKHGETLILY
ncbi:MAG: MBL fold metallo-hydrolase [Desulfomonilaceae bacterium]|nr:MBL fold metallo-hydrolase [Desulfomonilaceae bacterium]